MGKVFALYRKAIEANFDNYNFWWGRMGNEDVWTKSRGASNSFHDVQTIKMIAGLKKCPICDSNVQNRFCVLAVQVFTVFYTSELMNRVYLQLLVECQRRKLARLMPVDKGHVRTGEWPTAVTAWFRIRLNHEAESNMRQQVDPLWLRSRIARLEITEF